MTRRRRMSSAIVLSGTLALGLQLSCLPAALAQTAASSRPPAAVSSAALVRRALAANTQLAAARAGVDRARARVRQAGLSPNPTFDVEHRTGRLTGSPDERETTVGVALPLELFGQRGRRIELAEAEFVAAEASVAERERQLALEIRSVYAEALAAARELATYRQIERIDLDTARFVAARVVEGESAPLESNLFAAEIERQRSRQALAEGRLAAAVERLKVLSGVPAGEAIAPGEDLVAPPRTGSPASVEEAVQVALRTRPDVRLADLEIAAAEAGMRLVRAEARPSVVVFGRASVERSSFDDTPVGPIFDRDKTLAFGVSVTLPVFNRNQGAKAEAAAAVAEARLKREYVERLVRAEIEAAFARLAAAESAVSSYQQGVLPRAAENLRSIRAAYQVGAYRVSELLAEQRRYVEAEREYAEALAERYRAVAELESAVGVTVPAEYVAPPPSAPEPETYPRPPVVSDRGASFAPPLPARPLSLPLVNYDELTPAPEVKTRAEKRPQP